MSIEQEILAVINQIPAAIEKAFMEMVEKHASHNQKTHGRGGGVEGAKEMLSSRAASLGYKNIQFKKGKNGQIEVHAAGPKGGKLKKTKIHIDEKGRIISGNRMMTESGWGLIK